MIIAVNISKQLPETKNVLLATQRAWALNLANCQKHQYAIGVINGKILGHFNLLDVRPDTLEPNRVFFNLSLCSPADVLIIQNHISLNNVNLRYIVRGKYI